MIAKARRWLYALRTIRTYAESLNRRASVEQTLLDVANGKRAALSPDECRALAQKLGCR